MAVTPQVAGPSLELSWFFFVGVGIGEWSGNLAGDFVLPCNPLRFFLDLGRMESEERLREPDGVIERPDLIRAMILSSRVFVFISHSSLARHRQPFPMLHSS
jgi:hypothetical protein